MGMASTWAIYSLTEHTEYAEKNQKHLWVPALRAIGSLSRKPGRRPYGPEAAGSASGRVNVYN